MTDYRLPEGNAEFWEQRIQKHANSSDSSWADIFAVEKERESLIRWLTPWLTPYPITLEPTRASVIRQIDSFLDAGCNNGHSTAVYRKNFPEIDFYGCDLNQQAIDIASADCPNYFQHDVCEPFDRQWDAVYTSRVLCNLGTRARQHQAIKNLADASRKQLILQEPIGEGFRTLNAFRVEVGLPALQMPEQNLYLNGELTTKWLHDLGFRLLARPYDNHSTYFAITRVLKDKLNVPVAGQAYTSQINKLAALLPSVGQFSPHRFMVFYNDRETDDGVADTPSAQ